MVEGQKEVGQVKSTWQATIHLVGGVRLVTQLGAIGFCSLKFGSSPISALTLDESRLKAGCRVADATNLRSILRLVIRLGGWSHNL